MTSERETKNKNMQKENECELVEEGEKEKYIGKERRKDSRTTSEKK